MCSILWTTVQHIFKVKKREKHLSIWPFCKRGSGMGGGEESLPGRRGGGRGEVERAMNRRRGGMSQDGSGETYWGHMCGGWGRGREGGGGGSWFWGGEGWTGSTRCMPYFEKKAILASTTMKVQLATADTSRKYLEFGLCVILTLSHERILRDHRKAWKILIV
jgi:hypothetical protein